MNDAALRQDDSAGLPPASLLETVAVLRRHKGSILAWGAIGFALTLAFVCLQGPKFRATATILLERESAGGVLGDLAALATLSSAPAAASEILVLESRTLAEATVRAPAGDPLARDDDRHLGLTTSVQDKSLKPLSLFVRELTGAGPSDQPAVQPEARLFASITDYEESSPERIRVSFEGPARLHLTTPGLLERFGLRDEFPIDASYEPGKPVLYRGVRFYLRAEGDYAGQTFVIERVAPYEAVERLMRATTVAETALNSGVIEVVVEDSDPNRVAEITNALCNNYLDSVMARGQKRATDMVDYIEDLLNRQFGEFENAQEEIVRLQSEHPEMVAVEASAQAFIEQMAVIETERIKLDLNQFALRQMEAGLETGDATLLAGLGSEEGGLFVDPITLGYLQQISAANAQLSALEQEYTEEHYEVQNLRRTVADLEDRVRVQLRGRIESLGTQASELEKVRVNVEAQLAALPESARGLALPLLQLEVYKELFPFLVRSLQSAEMTRAASVTSAEYIDRAAPATELYSPSVLRLAIIGAFLGLAIGAGLAIVREPREGRIVTARELELVGGAPVLCTVPRFRGGRAGPRFLPLRDAPDGAAADAFRSLRSSLRAVLARTPGVSSVGLTGSVRGEGCSTTAVDLALALCLDGRDVLLVDADLRAPAVHASLAVAGSPGLAECLAGTSDWRDAVLASPYPATGPGAGKLRILPAGTLDGTPSSDLLSAATAQRLLEEAKREYEIVLVDLPPATAGADAEALAPALDGVLVVYRSGSTPRSRLVETVRRLRNSGARLLGQVLNALPTRGNAG